MKYISKADKISLMEELSNTYMFSVHQLMEILSLGAAQAIVEAFPLEAGKESCLIVVGPGYKGAQGFVCARHLSHFGYKPTLHVVGDVLRPDFITLQDQCIVQNFNFIYNLPSPECFSHNYNFIIDALYGINFTPPMRPGANLVLNTLIDCKLPICSLGIPSGWDPDNGCIKGNFTPHVLISNFAPLQGVSDLANAITMHYLTGRCLPPALQEKYELDIPEYPNNSFYVNLK
ncbi:NAD(P)H-hydrate epimerase [Blattella germanica]|nr:NAD(P)H-hydrate epimerase [Blattella germanica]